MDEFDVPTVETAVLDTSHLVTELQQAASDRMIFPVLLGKHVATFHDISGGYHRGKDYHVVNLIHEVQGRGSPFGGDVRQHTAEIHIDDCWYMDVDRVQEYDDYPTEDYVLSIHVTDYRHSPYSFADALQQDIDKREIEHTYE